MGRETGSDKRDAYAPRRYAYSLQSVTPINYCLYTSDKQIRICNLCYFNKRSWKCLPCRRGCQWWYLLWFCWEVLAICSDTL